ncbi:MAG TPA: helix-turn-helix transcriptional regulator [Candidatus Angelobacter sp.]|jgi:transcriptional regulator GlxA family with amidase domain
MGAFFSPRKNGVRAALSKAEPMTVPTINGSGKRNGVRPGVLIPVVQDGRLRKVLQMIASDAPHKIHELALECNLSESHLQHLFKQGTGLGLGRLISEQRMRRAADLLAQTNMNIKEIAWTVGYEHTSSFSRAFERHFGESPRAFRQRQVLENTNKEAV